MVKADETELRDMLESIAKELAPRYNGRLVIRRYEPIDGFRYVPGDHPYLYIEEEIRGRGFLGISRTERRMIFAVNEGFGGEAYGRKSMNIYLPSDDIAEEVVRRHLTNYTKRHNVTGIHEQENLEN